MQQSCERVKVKSSPLRFECEPQPYTHIWSVPFSLCENGCGVFFTCSQFFSICLLWLQKSENTHTHTHAHTVLWLQAPLCLCMDQCQSRHGLMPVCEPPERGPGAQQIGTLDSSVPPAFVCLRVYLCGEQDSVCMCVRACMQSTGYFVYFSQTLWLKVASAADALPPSSFSSSSSTHFLSFLSLSSHFLSTPFHMRITLQIKRNTVL